MRGLFAGATPQHDIDAGEYQRLVVKTLCIHSVGLDPFRVDASARIGDVALVVRNYVNVKVAYRLPTRAPR